MSHHDDHIDQRDELASAHLDGEATPGERAAVEADDDLMERVRTFARVRAAVAEVPAVDTDQRETAIAAVLGATEAPGAPEQREVADLEERRRAGTPRGWRIAAAAAAVALVLLAVPVIGSLGSRSDDAETAGEAATREAAPDADEQEGAGQDLGAADDGSGTEAPAAGAGGFSTTGDAIDGGDLGSFETVGTLAEALAGRLEAYGSALETAAEQAQRTDLLCAEPALEAAGDGASAVLLADAVLDGQAVVALVATLPAGTRTLVVVAAGEGCRIVDQRDLDP